jgi:ubiquinone/menaquinone biosynthesis C-methylase UbiE
VTTTAETAHLAGSAFDSIAESYDSLFTESLIGRAQRSAVWNKAKTVFRSSDHVLELNCGTGTDALFLASLGIRVTACDASAAMVEQARLRQALQAPDSPVEFHQLSTERLNELPSPLAFQGVFSNFSGLNCVADIRAVARLLASKLRPGAQLLLCLSTRFCAWETLHYLLAGNARKAFRRWNGMALAQMGPVLLPVYYPTVRSFVQFFGPAFRLRSITGIGITVPPSYMEAWASRHPSIFEACRAFDQMAHNCPWLRTVGDHVLLHLEKV